MVDAARESGWRRSEHETPVGRLVVVRDGAGAVVVADWADAAARTARLWRLGWGGVWPERAEPDAAVASVLGRYFGGAVDALFELPVRHAGTAFQARVWAGLRDIPAGQTRGYGELAAALGLARGAARAVGRANGDNLVSLFTPCHRVIGADGRLTGYAGGVARKRFLLEHEGAGAALHSSAATGALLFEEVSGARPNR